MNVQLNYLKVNHAKDLADFLLKHGVPTENRVLIISPDNDSVTKSGIIIPGSVKEGIPRKGVALTRGYIDECNKSYIDITDTGMVLTYGIYAGKEVEFDYLEEFLSNHPEGNYLRDIIKHSKFHILSLTEVIYAETNLSK